MHVSVAAKSAICEKNRKWIQFNLFVAISEDASV